MRHDPLTLSAWQRLRTRLHLFQAGLRKRLTVGVRAVVLDGDRVLLVRHTYLPGWQFPGGGVEPGETAQIAGAREAGEETGVEPLGVPDLHGLFLNRIAGGSRDHVAVYVWREWRQRRVFKPNLEIAECGWFGLDSLPGNVEAGTLRRLAEIRSASRPDPEW
jgi:8-oxo-dGTP pyrophosphatase MutT (NUDIX family)